QEKTRGSVMRLVAIVVALGLAGVPFGASGQPKKPPLPDLIVSNLTLGVDGVIVEVQNQGPGAAKTGTTVPVKVTRRVKDKDLTATVAVEVPAEPFALARVTVPYKKLGADSAAEVTDLVSVVLDPDNALAE